MEDDLRSAFDIAEDDEPVVADTTVKKRGRPPGSRKRKAVADDGTVHIGANFPIQISTELQRVCIERQERTRQKCSLKRLLAEGINHVLKEARRSPIAKED